MTLRYGVIGAGRVFQHMHLPCVRERPDLELVAVCDLDVARVRAELGSDAAAGSGGLLITDDPAEFFEAGVLDVVAVCTPNGDHAEPMREAIRRGLATLCEKPLAAQIEDARALAATPPGAGPVGVNLPYHFHELLEPLRERLGDGEVTIGVRFSTAGMRLWRPMTQWYGDPARAGGGALTDLGPHVIDALTRVLGQAEVLSCRIDQRGDTVVEERAAVTLRYERGTATIVIDRASRRPGFTVEATRADGTTVVVDLRRGQLTDGRDVLRAADPQPERAAVVRFLDAAAGTGPVTDVVSLGDALATDEIIEQARAIATVEPGLT